MRMKKQGWAFVVAVAGVLAALLALAAGAIPAALVAAGMALGAWWVSRLWSRRDPGPMPHALHWVLRLPRGPHSPRRLIELLAPESGERMLEIGPGIGVHSIPVAARLAPGGVLEVVDVQQAMLDDLERRAGRAGVGNIVFRREDAKSLRDPDGAFDGAFLISVLGEIPDRVGALRELRRVLAPGGRLVVGEVVVDPDYVPLPALEQAARAAGFELVRVTGPRASYLALLRPAVPASPGPAAGGCDTAQAGAVPSPSGRALRSPP